MAGEIPLRLNRPEMRYNMAGQISCDYCNNLVYDEEMEEYVYKNCPYYQSNDEYKIVRHQM